MHPITILESFHNGRMGRLKRRFIIWFGTSRRSCLHTLMNQNTARDWRDARVMGSGSIGVFRERLFERKGVVFTQDFDFCLQLHARLLQGALLDLGDEFQRFPGAGSTAVDHKIAVLL
jgi:hypothetical protein